MFIDIVIVVVLVWIMCCLFSISLMCFGKKVRLLCCGIVICCSVVFCWLVLWGSVVLYVVYVSCVSFE